jgi:hypothetical protein
MFGINQLGATVSENYAQAEKDRAAARKWWIFTAVVLASAFVYDATKKK